MIVHNNVFTENDSIGLIGFCSHVWTEVPEQAEDEFFLLRRNNSHNDVTKSSLWQLDQDIQIRRLQALKT